MGELADRLLELRHQKGCSQEELAAALGVSRQAVSAWERGEAIADLSNLVALARLYGVTLDDLVTGTANSSGVATAPPHGEKPSKDHGSESVQIDSLAKGTSTLKDTLLGLVVVAVPVAIVLALALTGNGLWAFLVCLAAVAYFVGCVLRGVWSSVRKGAIRAWDDFLDALK